MGGRLVLSTVGIKSPLDIAADDDPAGPAVADPPTPVASSALAHQPAPPRRPRSERVARPRSAAAKKPSGGEEAPFYGAGPRVQTSIALDADYAQLLEELARAARVTVNALAVAVLQAGLPPQSDAARAAIVEERVRRIDVAAGRVERNLRLPVHLRARVDELVATTRERVARVNRADLVNAVLGSALPGDAQQAAELVADYTRRLERAAA